MANDMFLEPREILYDISDDATQLTEMTEWEHGFLCGLIQKYRPSKILEIGVSAGGTTAVILNALSLLGTGGSLYSVDYLPYYYKDKTKKVGFLADKAKEKLSDIQKIKHKLLAGSGIYDYLQEIGDGIDFLIIDTMHICPGEILDFLACLPFLSEHAVVVLHDIAMQFANNANAFVTQLLLDTVSAKKIVGSDPHSKCELNYPNIGAFEISEDTKSNIKDVFSSLLIPWKYIPKDLDKYRKIFGKHYEKDCITMFDIARANNEKLVERKSKNKFQSIAMLTDLHNRVRGKKVYIYGEGNIGKIINHLLLLCGDEIVGHIVSDGEPITDAISLKDISLGKDEIIVVGVGPLYIQTVIGNLEARNISEYIVPDRLVYEEYL